MRFERAPDSAGDLDSVRLAGDYYDSFVELHIEQGPLLERRNVADWSGDRDCRAGQFADHD